MSSSYSRLSKSRSKDSLVSMDLGTQDAIPINLRVKNLNYTVLDKPGKWWQKITNIQMPWEWMEKATPKTILHDVSFTAKSGQVMAIMGGSGSGKTSLLDVLACRSTVGFVTGDVYLNSVVRTKDILDSCAGYVRQDDRLISFLTVMETLTFVARLRLPPTSSDAHIKERVMRVITDLGLKHVVDSKIGDESIRGLSGGERRRVSIGIQLLILPSLLFLDEPTSGLDSFTANNLVQTLSRLASRRRTIVMSIHQPRFEIFSLVDTMMILSDGKTVYNGPCRDMVSYFTTLGFPCPEHTNPCDFYIDLATVDFTERERERKSLKVVKDLQEAYEAHANAVEVIIDQKDIITEEEFKQSVDSGVGQQTSLAGRNDRQTLQNMLDAFARTRKGPSLFAQTRILFKRFFRITIDDYPMLLVHIFQAVMMSILVGTAFFNLQKDQLSIRDWFGFMFIVSALYPYMVILGIIGVCHDERRYLYFELQDKLYHPAAFYMGKILNDIPFHFVYNFCYCIPLYEMTGLEWDIVKFFLFYLFVSVSVFVSRMLAMMSGSVFPTYQLSCVMAQTLFSILLMSAGFFININNIPEETKWISDSSYLRWGYQALCIVQVKDLEFQCQDNTSCVSKGDQAMLLYGLDDSGLWLCAVVLASTLAVFMIIMYLGYRYVPQKPHND